MRAPSHNFLRVLLALLCLCVGCNLEDEGTVQPDTADSGGELDVGAQDASDTPQQADSCSDAQTTCGGSCVDLTSNPDHCGECGRACEAPNAVSSGCTDGVCELSCRSGFVDANDDLLSPDGDGCETACEPTTDGMEVCDRVDNDCDGEVDEGVKTTWYLDADEDGYGQDADPVEQCDRPSPRYVETAGDCNDADPDAFPGQTSYFAEPLEGGGFDYDCDGVETPVNTDVSVGPCVYAGRCGRIQTVCAPGPDASGWRDGVPECGESAAVFSGCITCSAGGNDCTSRATYQLVEQRCR